MKLIPLCDGDIFQYECGFAAETSWKHKMEREEPEWFLSNPPPFDIVREIIDQRIEHILYASGATEQPVFFFTGKKNFRNEIAKRTPYKQRSGTKPYHYKNIKAYLQGIFEWHQEDGLEADDLMAIRHFASDKTTIICSRDKDMYQLHGHSFSWELGNSPQFGPEYISGYGRLHLSDDRKKLKGVGPKFFLAQCLMGDPVDSVPGVPRCGPKKAFDILNVTSCYKEGLSKVNELYETVFRDRWEEELLEQGQLLWLVRELDENNKPILWNTSDAFTEKIERSCIV